MRNFDEDGGDREEEECNERLLFVDLGGAGHDAVDSQMARNETRLLRRQGIIEDEKPQPEQEWRTGITAQIAIHNERDVLGGTLGVREWLKWSAAFGGCCAYCGKKPKSVAIEHVVPLCRGGRSSIWNVVPACKSCNSRKGKRQPEAWLTADALDRFFERVMDARTRCT